MKGVLFHNQDCGRGGVGGYLAHYQAWCVEIDGKKLHIHSELTGEVGFAPESGGPRRDVSVTPCDASCTRLVDVDEWTVKEVLGQIEITDHPLTAQEKDNLPPGLAGTTYLSELIESYQRMMKSRDQERKRAEAGFHLFLSVKNSVLRWLLKNEIRRYEEVTR